MVIDNEDMTNRAVDFEYTCGLDLGEFLWSYWKEYNKSI